MGIFRYDVNRYTPLQMAIIPTVIFILALVSLGMMMMATGMPVRPGIDFSGGTAVTVFTTDTPEEIRTYFAGFPLVGDPKEGPNNGLYLTFSAMSDTDLKALSDKVLARYPDAKIDQIGESFGKTLQQQASIALVFSFIGMAIVVFVAFRTFVPSAAVVTCALSDIVITAACMNLFGIPLNLGTTAALLMLIGYSVDSDILLTMRTLKRQGKLDEKLAGAFQTGIIMTTTTIAAVTAMAIVAYFGNIQMVYEIALVLIIGLFVDIMNTWLTNAGLIKWYILKRGGR
jgi:preprotein translocase subunit SecF